MAKLGLSKGLVRSILVAGCSNSALANVYLISLSYTGNITSSPLQNANPARLNPSMPAILANLSSGINRNATSLEIRTGYLGHCMKQNSGLWICARNAEALANAIRDQKASDADPLNLLYMSKAFKDQMVFSGLIFASIPFVFICFLLLSTFPGWHEKLYSSGSEQEVRPFPSRLVSQLATVLVGLASLLIFVSVFWQHISSAAGVTMGEELNYGAVDGHIGVVSMVLGWGGVIGTALVFLGLIIMLMSISIVSKLIDL
ncbi:hypothetical protein PAAG_00887 [Paracoccidioides lutzii Pb01]|uniref:Membrane fusion mating protein FIG1 n=1 Tax=Paracoccidioides lutzii (strain ATCC MYA-826 / Pb01) TaxID=502779 RepID=C1GQU2_PARBA|nr:hypothetical protein PAAG_00887 [Paracoccidioides lutzii Pb01]EEH37966.2 hypothetical protein PAAG_00887 [Paracoccidioides lutzii Pb01]